MDLENRVKKDLENRVKKLEFDLLQEKHIEHHHHVHHTEEHDKEDTTSLYIWFLVPVFLLIFVGILGPWYSDCNNNNCSVNKLSGSKISDELKTTIIRKAALLQKDSKKKK